MELAHLLAFNAALCVALISPGPAMLVSLKATLAGGRAQGIQTGLGLATMASVWTLMALLGLSGLLSLFPWAYAILKTAGALYLIWLAVRTWRQARAPLPDLKEARLGRAYLDGLFVNAANPKSVLFAGAVLVVVFPEPLGLAEKAIVVANHFVVEAVAYSLFAMGLSRPVIRRGYLGAKHVFDRIAGATLGALGLRLLVDRP